MIQNFSLKQIERIVKNRPNSIAIKKNNFEITYKKFWSDCCKFSNYIITKKKNPIVSILGNHEYFDYVCIFGTLLSGGTYVPINSELPLVKIKRIISLSNSSFLCSKKNYLKILLM